VGVLLGLAVPAHAATVLVLGDSISAAYGMETAQGWVARLAQRLQKEGAHRVVNASISGETTSGGLNRLPALLARVQPDLVVIELGANDGLRGTPLTAVKANLAALISQSQRSGARVLLLGMRIPPNYGPRYSEGFHALYATLSERYGAALMPFLLEGVAGNPALMQADGLHPGASAQMSMLDNLWPYLQPLLGAVALSSADSEAP